MTLAACLGVACLAAFLLFFRLGTLSLMEPDEPRYAEAAREMLERSDLVTPTFNYDIRFDKPVLIYWLIILAYKLFGMSEWSARFFPALFGVGTVLVTFALARALAGLRTALYAGVSLATTLGVVLVGRIANTDMALTFFLTSALALFLLSHRGKIRSRAGYWASYAAVALAALVKGPIALAIFVGIILAYLAWTRSLSSWKTLQAGPGALIFAAVALPWYAMMLRIHGWAFLEAFVFRHHLDRYFGGGIHHIPNVFYYVPVFLVAALPWGLFSPWVAARAARALRGGGAASPRHQQVAGSSAEGESLAQEDLKALIVWIGFIFVFFSISRGKLPTYILPLLPAWAILLGWAWDSFFGVRPQRGLTPTRAFAAVVCAFVIAAVSAGVRILPMVEETRSAKPLGEFIRQNVPDGGRVLTFHFNRQSLAYYAQRRIHSVHDLGNLQKQILDESSYVVAPWNHGEWAERELVRIQAKERLSPIARFETYTLYVGKRIN